MMMTNPGKLACVLCAALLMWAFQASQAFADPDCTCRYSGQEVALNQCVCMITPDGMRRACCGLVLNNTSWTFFNDGCVVASSKKSEKEALPRSVRKNPS